MQILFFKSYKKGKFTIIKYLEKSAEKWCPNIYLRTIAGSAVIIVATMLIGTDYNGAGMNIIENAMNEESVMATTL